MRSVYFYLVLSVAVSFSALADVVPYDPEVAMDSGGDATGFNYTGVPITVGVNGGGIFVFHNATGVDLTELDLNLEFPLSPLPEGFLVKGTIGVPSSPVRQHPSFNFATFSGMPCDGVTPHVSCVELKFILTPGPLIPINGNFVLDFNNSANYTSVDYDVLNGTYTGGDVPGGTGAWAPNGVPTRGNALPGIPEPSYRTTAACMGLGLLIVWNWRRRLTTKKT